MAAYRKTIKALHDSLVCRVLSVVEAALLVAGRAAPFILSLLVLTGCPKKKTQPLQFGSMTHDFEIKWSRDAFPLAVIVDTNMADPLLGSVAHAVYTWNEALGHKVFTVEYMNLRRDLPDTPCGWIAVVQDDKMEHDGLWRGRYHEDNIVCCAQISLKMDFTAEDRVRNNIVIHEFGHALGLSHDTKDISSIMHPKIWNDLYQHITDEDIKAIQDHYFNPIQP